MAKVATFVIRDEDVDKVMAAVQALHLSPPEQDDVGGFLLRMPTTTKLAKSTIQATNCSGTGGFPPSDGNCADCGVDA